jgi:hypothetical protein
MCSGRTAFDPSQFSREYRRMFGAPPRKDVAAIKVEA